MSIASTMVSGFFACVNYDAACNSNARAPVIAGRLNAFPARQTAYKVSAFCWQAACACFCASSVARALGSLYVMANHRVVLFSSSVSRIAFENLASGSFIRNVRLTETIGVSMLILAIPFYLYARSWDLPVRIG